MARFRGRKRTIICFIFIAVIGTYLQFYAIISSHFPASFVLSMDLHDSYKKCMLNDNGHSKSLSHPDSPFYSLPSFDKLLSPISAKTSLCDQSVENLHVLVILTQPHLMKIRKAIRETFAVFPFPGNESETKGNWTRMFLIGLPRSHHEEKLIEKEVKEFGDIVITNTPEGYYNYPTLKMLIALKFVSCYCPNAVYFVKTDDDNYINIEFLYNKIRENQEKTDREFPTKVTDIKSGDKFQIPLWMGHSSLNETARKGKWAIRYEEYRYSFTIPTISKERKKVYFPEFRGVDAE